MKLAALALAVLAHVVQPIPLPEGGVSAGIVLDLPRHPDRVTVIYDVFAPIGVVVLETAADFDLEPLVRLNGINLRGRVPPGGAPRLHVHVQMPPDVRQIPFRVLQTLDNGTVVSWTDPPGGAHPVLVVEIPGAPAKEGRGALVLVVAAVAAVVVLGSSTVVFLLLHRRRRVSSVTRR